MAPRASHLSKPVAVPATSHKLGSPFLRAYPPILASYGVSRDEFLSFLDRLNRASVASPPVQVLGLAGNLVSSVPIHTAQIVGGAVNAAATLTTFAMSKGKTEVLLRNINQSLFAPRGLKVEIARLDALAKLAGDIDPVTGVSNGPTQISAQERRMQVMEAWIQHLEISPLPQSDTPDNVWSKLHTTASERQRNKEEKKLLKGRKKAHKDFHKDSAEAERNLNKKMTELREEEQKVLRKEKGKKLGSELRKVEKERHKLEKEYGKEISKIEKDFQKDDKEQESIRKILWLLIQDLNDGNGSIHDEQI
ncbi:hypothetical protein SUNI508_10165 [Seiridium unicorne]|uniref:Uncharacterized protein n=1 Tax=Seiridium unicorne TaxID=138068 RepID=A0ABR2UM23_9PEZI